MKRYQCHKVVEATKVKAAERDERRHSWMCACDDGSIQMIPDHHKITEEDLGYVVRYEDGYQSWSPAKVFEDGYTLIAKALASNSGGE